MIYEYYVNYFDLDFTKERPEKGRRRSPDQFDVSPELGSLLSRVLHRLRFLAEFSGEIGLKSSDLSYGNSFNEKKTSVKNSVVDTSVKKRGYFLLQIGVEKKIMGEGNEQMKRKDIEKIEVGSKREIEKEAEEEEDEKNEEEEEEEEEETTTLPCLSPTSARAYLRELFYGEGEENGRKDKENAEEEGGNGVANKEADPYEGIISKISTVSSISSEENSNDDNNNEKNNNDNNNNNNNKNNDMFIPDAVEVYSVGKKTKQKMILREVEKRRRVGDEEDSEHTDNELNQWESETDNPVGYKLRRSQITPYFRKQLKLSVEQSCSSSKPESIKNDEKSFEIEITKEEESVKSPPSLELKRLLYIDETPGPSFHVGRKMNEKKRFHHKKSENGEKKKRHKVESGNNHIQKSEANTEVEEIENNEEEKEHVKMIEMMFEDIENEDESSSEDS
jgi:hypothetical protein